MTSAVLAAPPQAEFAVEVDDLTKCFGDFCAVDHLDFKVKHGEVFGLLGPNGAGKSTVIRMLTTLVLPTSGRARIIGHDIVRAANEVRQAIGVIPQAMTSDLDLSAWENMNIFAKLYGIPREKRRREIKRLLEEVDLVQWADKPVKMFSGGMRRRLEIARGLVHEPDFSAIRSFNGNNMAIAGGVTTSSSSGHLRSQQQTSLPGSPSHSLCARATSSASQTSRCRSVALTRR